MVSSVCKSITFHTLKGAAVGCAVGTTAGVAIASMFFIQCTYLTNIARTAIAQSDHMLARVGVQVIQELQSVCRTNTVNERLGHIFMASVVLVASPVVGSVVGACAGFIQGCRQARQ